MTNTMFMAPLVLTLVLCTSHSVALDSIASVPDSGKVLAVQQSGAIGLWDVSSLRLSSSWILGGGAWEGIKSVALSPDGSKVVLATRGHASVTLCSTQTGETLSILRGHPSYVQSVCFSPDGRHIVSSSMAGTNFVFDESTRELTPDGQFQKVGVREIEAITANMVIVWQADSGQPVRSFDGHRDDVNTAVFGPKGEVILSGSSDGTLMLWELRTGKVLKTYMDQSESVESVAFSPDGRLILSGGSDNAVRLWDRTSGRILRTFRGHSQTIESVVFSPDGQTALSGSWDGTARLWDVMTGECVRELGGHQGVVCAAFVSQGQHIVTGTGQEAIKVWDVSTGNHVTLLSRGDEWACFTPDRYFDSSRHGGELVSAVRGLDVFAIDQFALYSNRPDIVLSRLNLGTSELVRHFHSHHVKRLRRMGFPDDDSVMDLHVPEVLALKTRQEGKKLHLSCELSDPKYKLKCYTIFVNDVPVYGAMGKGVGGHTCRVSEVVELGMGKNKVEVSCLNEKGAESFRAMTYADYSGQVTRDLYFLGFGVSQYTDSRLNLRYAAKDVNDLANVFGNMEGKGFRRVYSQTYLDGEVSLTNIEKAREFAARACVDDVLVLFVAGHGVHDKTDEAIYYFIVHDTDVTDLSNTAANYEMIEAILYGLSTRNKLFLMDTCESGEIDEDRRHEYFTFASERGILPRASRGLAGVAGGVGGAAPRKTAREYLLDRNRYIYNDLLRRSGAIAYSSCRGNEFSFESDRIENGFFTEEIMRALTSQAADKDGNSAVSTSELHSFVSESVRRATGGKQTPTVDRDNIYQEFAFPVLR